MVIWPRIVGFLFVGYLSLTRSFAYLGIPPLFIGEIALAAFLVLKPRVALGTWVASLLRPSPLNTLGIALFAFIAYGVWQVGRGVLDGNGMIYTLKFFVFNYYAVYLFLGLWVGLQVPHFLRKLVRVTAWVNGIYGIAFIVALRYVPFYMPGYDNAVDVPLFSPPAGQVVVILGLLCFERDLRAVWFVLLLNIVVTLVWQVRAEWFGLALGAFTWGLLTGRLGRLVAIGMAGVALIGMLEFADIKLPGRRGYNVSLSENVARVIAPIDLQLAKQFSPKAADHAGTAEWRELWWEQIWISGHSTRMLEAFGHGYGFELFGLAPESVRGGQEEWDVRTPHSIFFYLFGYSGWVGVALFAIFQFSIVRLLWRAFRLSGQPAGLVLWVTIMATCFFELSFETPYKAIPFYLLMGMAMAPALQPRGRWRHAPISRRSSALPARTSTETNEAFQAITSSA